MAKNGRVQLAASARVHACRQMSSPVADKAQPSRTQRGDLAPCLAPWTRTRRSSSAGSRTWHAAPARTEGVDRFSSMPPSSREPTVLNGRVCRSIDNVRPAVGQSSRPGALGRSRLGVLGRPPATANGARRAAARSRSAGSTSRSRSPAGRKDGMGQRCATASPFQTTARTPPSTSACSASLISRPASARSAASRRAETRSWARWASLSRLEWRASPASRPRSAAWRSGRLEPTSQSAAQARSCTR